MPNAGTAAQARLAVLCAEAARQSLEIRRSGCRLASTSRPCLIAYHRKIVIYRAGALQANDINRLGKSGAQEAFGSS